MAFEKKEWKDRLVEFAGRRTLTDISTGTSQTVDVARAEGQISQAGDAISAENMNDLEQRIGDAFSITDNNVDELIGDLSGVSFYPETDGLYAEYKVGADTVRKKLGSGVRLLYSNQVQTSTANLTYNIKQLFPDSYTELTVDNFICQVKDDGRGTVVSSGLTSGDGHTASIPYFSRTYDASAGMLSVGYCIRVTVTSGVSSHFRFFPFDIYFADFVSV